MSTTDTEGLAERLALLPCPFCGGECDPDGWSSTERTGPACDQCGATADTTNMWNTRPGRWTQKDIDGAKIEATEMAEYFSRDDSGIKHRISAPRSLWRGEAEKALREARGFINFVSKAYGPMTRIAQQSALETIATLDAALTVLASSLEEDKPNV